MLLRRITKHVKDQNWFAVGIDFVIVVIGVFIGIQVANWNDARAAHATEEDLIQRLDEEFDVIEAAFDDTLDTLPVYLEATKSLLGVARGEFDVPEDELKRIAYYSINLGRPPLKSATYQQLVTSGDLKLLRNADLRNTLVQYHQAVDRQAFLYPQTLEQIIALPDYLDLPWRSMDADLEFPPPQEIFDEMVIDREALKGAEQGLEGLVLLQYNLVRAAMDQDKRVREVKAAVDEARN